MKHLYEITHNVVRNNEVVEMFYNMKVDMSDLLSDLVIVDGYNKEIAKNHKLTRARRVKPSWNCN